MKQPPLLVHQFQALPQGLAHQARVPACPFFGSRVVFHRADEPLAEQRGLQAAAP